MSVERADRLVVDRVLDNDHSAVTVDMASEDDFASGDGHDRDVRIFLGRGRFGEASYLLVTADELTAELGDRLRSVTVNHLVM